jgi:para-nitrobenzyl esterase
MDDYCDNQFREIRQFRHPAGRADQGEEMMIRSKLMAAAAAVLCLVGATASAQTVKIAQGSLRGTTEGDAEAFKNIPFAAPPVGALRWKAPQPAKGWSSVRDATAFGNSCIQPPPNANMGAESAIGYALGDQGPLKASEDCLNLNVRRPAGTKASAKLPVMVWIYGGGFQIGTGSQRTYTGTGLVKRGVILVTPNYRLGALGFLAHPALSAESAHHVSGNYGVLDAIAALQWVKRNIAAFGGDPNNVTIFGESAGAAAVGYLSGSPLTRGLFNRTIVESGNLFGIPDRGAGDIVPGAVKDPLLVNAEQAGTRWMKQAGVTSIAAARALTPEQVLAATEAGPGRPPISFRPNIDGWFMPKPSFELLRNGAYNHPVIIGSNNDEGVLFFQDPTMTLAQYRDIVRRNWGAHADAVFAAYPAANDTEALHAVRDLQRDSTFGWTAWTWAKGQRGAPVYVYNFDHRPPFPKMPKFDDVQAPHAVELAYVFGELYSPLMSWSKDDYAISDTMIGYWTNFAKNGDPNGPGLPRWTPAGADGQQSMHFGASTAEMGEIGALPRLKALDQYYSSARPGGTGK